MSTRDTIFLSNSEYDEARRKGFITERNRDWVPGDVVDLYGPPYELGLTGTVTEIEGKQCVIEIW